MVRARSTSGLRTAEIVLPLEFVLWRDAYSESHDDALANNRPIRIEVWKLRWSMQDLRRATVTDRRALFSWGVACKCGQARRARRAGPKRRPGRQPGRRARQDQQPQPDPDFDSDDDVANQW
eukprot:13075028-Alexandrium_andersonii.AAC.1